MEIVQYILMILIILSVGWFVWGTYKSYKKKIDGTPTKKELPDIDEKTRKDSLKSTNADADFFFPWWVIVGALVSSFVCSISVAPFDGNNKTLLLFGGGLLALMSIPIIIAWGTNKKHRVIITIISFLSFIPILNLPVALIWATFGAKNHDKPEQVIKIKKLIPLIVLLSVLFVWVVDGIYKKYNVPKNQYASFDQPEVSRSNYAPKGDTDMNLENRYVNQMISGCMNVDGAVKDKRGFCNCSGEKVVRAIIKQIGPKEFIAKYQKEPYLGQMQDMVIDKCGHYLK